MNLFPRSDLHGLAFTETERDLSLTRRPEGRRTYRSMNASRGRTEASGEIPRLTARRKEGFWAFYAAFFSPSFEPSNQRVILRWKQSVVI